MISAEDYGSAAHQMEVVKRLAYTNQYKVFFLCHVVVYAEALTLSLPNVLLFPATRAGFNGCSRILSDKIIFFLSIGLANNAFGMDCKIAQKFANQSKKVTIMADDFGIARWTHLKPIATVMAVNELIYQDAINQGFDAMIIGSPKHWDVHERLPSVSPNTKSNDASFNVCFFAQPSFIDGYKECLEQIVDVMSGLLLSNQHEIIFNVRPHPSEPLPKQTVDVLQACIPDQFNIVSQVNYWELLATTDIAMAVSSTALKDWIIVQSFYSMVTFKPIYCMLNARIRDWHYSRGLASQNAMDQLGEVVCSSNELRDCVESFFNGLASNNDRETIKRVLVDPSMGFDFFRLRLGV